VISVSTRGVTRLVILTRHHAIKIPRFWWYGRFRWETFLWGLLANMQERRIAAGNIPEVCPVRWSIPGGWLLVMPRCAPLEREMTAEEYEAFVDHPGYRVPAENKPDSFGYLNGRLVAVDYGS
jgi:hypothetical protein